MPQPNLLEFAKQGNVESIAALLNRSLQPKGITVVKTAFKNGCLEILLESAFVPNQQALLAFVHQRITRLEAASIRLVRVYVRQTGEEFPAWSQEFELLGQPLPPIVKPQLNLLEAKQGNVEAIAALMNRSLQPKGINVVKTAFKDDCLSILLESTSVPNQQALVEFVRQGLTRYRAASIKQVKVYGRQTGEEFPAWSQEFELLRQPLPPVLKPQPAQTEAKQRNVTAIAALMNRSLQPKGITVVKTALKDGCLSILLESTSVPNQQALVEFVRQGLTRYSSTSIKQVKVYGQQTGDEFPAWSQEFELRKQPSPLVLKPQPTQVELASQGNVTAIATLMNRSLQTKGITVVKTALKNGCLSILLESASIPNQQALVEFVRQGLTRYRAASIKQVKVYGRQTGEEFPAWSQEVEVLDNTSSSPTAQLQANNYSEQITKADVSAKPFVVNAHKKFWQLPSLVRFGVVGIILLVVGLNIFVIFYSNEIANFNAEDRNKSNSDEQYKYILNDFIKAQLKNEEDIVRGMELFKDKGGFDLSKQRAIKNCQALTKGVIKEKLIQSKSNEVMNDLKISKSSNKLTDKEMQQMNYLSAIYASEVLAGQDVYCPETRNIQVRS